MDLPRLAMLLLLAFACSTAGDVPDADHDGTADPYDCDDENAAVHPGAPESCNKIDDNCDGTIDEGVLVDVWPDRDGDGVGNGSNPLQGCPIDGWAAEDGDCDDDDPAVHPGAEDVCNGIDDDCDGEKDAAEGAWTADLDGDGFGDDATAVQTCTPPAGYIQQGGDCDDGDALIHPGAEERCNAEDDDCDGVADLGVESDWHSDADGDGFGSPVEHVVTCTPEAGWVLDDTDCRPSDAAGFPGAPELCNSVDDSCDGVVDEGYDQDGDGHQALSCPTGDDCDDGDATSFPDAPETCGDLLDQDCDGLDLHCGYQGDYELVNADVRATGASMPYTAGHIEVGDVNGDGYDDLALNNIVDGVTIVRGPLSGAVDLEAAATTFTGDMNNIYGGRSIGVGDVNDDGLDDVGFGAPYGTDDGLYIVYGPVDTDVKAQTDADAYLRGRQGTMCGHGANILDVTGDGIADGIVGCYTDNSYGGYGVAYVFEGPLQGDYTRGDATAVLYSSGGGWEYAGRWIQGDGDIDGDGMDDLLVAAPYSSGAAPVGGAIYVFLAPVTSDADFAAADARLLGSTVNGALGEYRTMSLGDADGDGRDDALVGAMAVGEVSLFLSPSAGDYETATADATIVGAGTSFGTGLDLQDIDGNGVGDVLIGDAAAGGDVGASYIFWDLRPGAYTTADASGVFRGEAAGSQAGIGGAFADMSGDGLPDIVVGAWYLATNGGFYVENQER